MSKKIGFWSASFLLLTSFYKILTFGPPVNAICYIMICSTYGLPGANLKLKNILRDPVLEAKRLTDSKSQILFRKVIKLLYNMCKIIKYPESGLILK